MGVPLEILSDNDNLITSEFFSELCSNLGIFQHKAILYRPKGNGRAERAVRSVVDILRLCLAENYGEKCWIKYLPGCTFLINSLPESSHTTARIKLFLKETCYCLGSYLL